MKEWHRELQWEKCSGQELQQEFVVKCYKNDKLELVHPKSCHRKFEPLLQKVVRLMSKWHEAQNENQCDEEFLQKSDVWFTSHFVCAATQELRALNTKVAGVVRSKEGCAQPPPQSPTSINCIKWTSDQNCQILQSNSYYLQVQRNNLHSQTQYLS